MAELALLDEREQKQAHDPALQLAPRDDDGPNIQGTVTAFQNTVRDCTSFVSQCRQNFETRFSIWNGQSSDNKKHSREGDNPEPTPWDGASDMRVYEVDHAINTKVAMLSMARRKANLIAKPVNGNEIKRSKLVASFMRWLLNTQVPEIDREDELLAQYLNEQGVALQWIFWEKRQEKVLDVLKLDELQSKMPQGLDLQVAIQQPHLQEHFEAVLMEHYDISRKKARSMVKELRTKGETSKPVVGRVISRPVIRALSLHEDVFIPPYATDLEGAPYVFVVRYHTAEQLRSFVNTDEWDADWVESAIETCKGKLITLVPDQSMEPISRNYIFRYQRYSDLIGVVYGYQRLSDDDGIPGIYRTVFNPDLPSDHRQPGYAKYGLSGERHGRYPFVLHRREFLSRRIHDSRGLPEVGKSFQDNIKALRDSRLDAASLDVLPTLLYPLGRPPGAWGPGARVPERRAGEYHYAERVGQSPNTEKSEEVMMACWREYLGEQTGEEDQAIPAIIGQFESDRYLRTWAKTFWHVWKLYQQYGDDKVFFQVIGVQKATPMEFQKGDPNEDFDFLLTFDTINFDREAVREVFEQILAVLQQADKNGQVDWGEFLQLYLDSISPSIAERILQPQETATQQMVERVHGDLSQIFSGIGKNFQQGTPTQLAQQLFQQWMQQPDVQAKYSGQDQSGQAFKQRADTYAKQVDFQTMQQRNALIGKMGAVQQ